MSQDWPEFTERQLEAWPGAVAEAQHYVDGTITEDHHHWDWEIRWHEETHPGRGHKITATWSDGEHLVQITMDVYGYPAVSVAEICWIHNSADEECGCGLCLLDRDREEAEAVSTQKNPTSVKETTDMDKIESGVADELLTEVAVQVLREAADGLERRINEPGLILLADTYGGYHAGERARGQREADVLRALADNIKARS